MTKNRLKNFDVIEAFVDNNIHDKVSDSVFQGACNEISILLAYVRKYAELTDNLNSQIYLNFEDVLNKYSVMSPTDQIA